MKKTFIILGGFCKTATTSLHHCLTSNNVITTGDCKEHCYLNTIEDFMNGISHLKSYGYMYKLKRLSYLMGDWIRDWNELSCVQRDFFTTQSPSIEQYLNYYLEVADKNKNISVIGDFTVTYPNLDVFILNQLKEKFDPYFNVKVILSLRDPVERLFSELRYIQEVGDIKTKRASMKSFNIYANKYENLYSKTYQKYSTIFPTFCLDTSAFINQKYKKTELENFLETSIPNFNPVKINTTQQIKIPDYYYNTAKKIFNAEIDFYQSHV